MSRNLKVLGWMEKRQSERSHQRPKESLTAIHLQEHLIGTKSGENGDKMSKNLLIESMPSMLSLVEGTAGNKVIARGEFGRVGVPTQNGRIYSEELMNREIKRLHEDMRNRSSRMLGHCDHPADGKTSLEHASHLITDLKIKDGIVIGEAEILPTPAGEILKKLIEAKVQIGVSSRGYGSTAPARGSQEGEDVQDDFVLKTYDFVADPAMRSAIPEVHMEDVDMRSVANVLMEACPDIVDELKGTVNANVLIEAKNDKSTKLPNSSDEVEQKIKDELVEDFEHKLRDAIADMREDVVSEVREELEEDPEVGGAKGVLAAIAEMVSAYRGDVDQQAVKDAIKASELSVSESNRERDSALKAAKRATHLLYIERKISKHPMSESIRNSFKNRDFEDIKDVEEALNTMISELPRVDDIVTKEDAKIREENVELRGNIGLLESKVEELNSKLRKAVTLGQRIDEQRINETSEMSDKISELEKMLEEANEVAESAKTEANEVAENARKLVENAELEVYKRDKVVGLTNGRRLIGLMESIHDRAGVDELVDKQGSTVVEDPELQRMRYNLSKGKTGSGIRLEEELDKPNKKKTDELGNDVSSLARLAGIPGR